MESVLYKGRPAFFSFFPFYFPSLYILIVSIYLLLEKPEITEFVSSIFSSSLRIFSYYIFIVVVIIIPSLGFAISKLNLKYFLFPLVGLILSLILKHFYLEISFENNPNATWFKSNLEVIFFLGFSSISIINTEFYRRSHLYEITAKYIKTSAGILNHRERIMPISKINDIAINQTGFGKVLNYGSIIPVSASGMGMGSSFAAVSGSGTMKLFKLPYLTLTVTGGHTIQVPKSRTFEALIGIRNYKKALKIIMNNIKQ
jgi:membrane protein YdbS with pleckstrin-like domain